MSSVNDPRAPSPTNTGYPLPVLGVVAPESQAFHEAAETANATRAAGWMRSRAWQVVATIGAWAYIVLLHWRNDGLWYLGDSAAHAANGAFWWDFLTSLPHDPFHYALSYYARYPVINPTAYPPFFYLVEGALYRVFGISPYVPRAMVLACMLLGAIYLVEWIRRWIGAEAGWIGALFVLQPATVIWGNAIMLNLPSTVMAIAALYHTRRWLQDLGSRHLYGAGIFGVIAILTYTPSLVVVPLMIGLVLVERKVRVLFTGRVLLVAGVAALALIPWVAITFKWAPGHRRANLYMGPYPWWRPASWLYYPEALPPMVSVVVLALAALAVFFACTDKRWRPEFRIGLTWLAICYVWFSLISVKEGRYALLMVPACLLLAANATAALLDAMRSVRWRSIQQGAALAAIMLLHVPSAYAVKVRRINGFQDIVAFMADVAPHEWVFYSGEYNGIFAYYLRAHDPQFSRGMVRSSKLLYTTLIDRRFGLQERVHSAAEVLQALRQGCGCRYLVVEREASPDIPAEQYLRELLRSDEFRLVRTFQVKTPTVRHVDIYWSRNPGSLCAHLRSCFLS